MVQHTLLLKQLHIYNFFECISDSGLGCTAKRYCTSIFMYADDIIL